MARFSWFKREPGKGNVLDPSGLFSGGKISPQKQLLDPFGLGYTDENKNTQQKMEATLDPFNLGLQKGNQSTDQYVGRAMDPGNFFKGKERSSYLGPSRVDMNVQRFDSMKTPRPQVYNVDEENPYMESSYYGMLKGGY